MKKFSLGETGTMSTNLPQQIYKVVVVGDYGIGKTCLSQRFTTGLFKSLYKMTVGLQISARILTVDQILTKLVIWDTAGQERFATIRPKYYQGADCAIVGFDMSRQATLEHVPKWITETRLEIPKVPILLVGLKNDLGAEINRFDIQKIAGSYDLPVILTSSKTGLNVDRAFELLVRLIHGADPIGEEPMRL
jgi:small GTP-binding protein